MDQQEINPFLEQSDASAGSSHQDSALQDQFQDFSHLGLNQEPQIRHSILSHNSNSHLGRDSENEEVVTVFQMREENTSSASRPLTVIHHPDTDHEGGSPPISDSNYPKKVNNGQLRTRNTLGEKHKSQILNYQNNLVDSVSQHEKSELGYSQSRSFTANSFAGLEDLQSASPQSVSQNNLSALQQEAQNNKTTKSLMRFSYQEYGFSKGSLIDHQRPQQMAMKIVIQNEEVPEDEQENNLVQSSIHLSPNRIVNKQNKGHFRGESFGNCDDPRIQQESGDQSQQPPSLARKLSKTDSFRNLTTYFNDEVVSQRSENYEGEVQQTVIKNSTLNSENLQTYSIEEEEEDGEEEKLMQDEIDLNVEQKEEFVILKQLVDQYSKNSNLIKHLSNSYDSYKQLKKVQLIERLMDRDSKYQKLKVKMRSLQDNNTALAYRLERRSKDGKYLQQSEEVENLKSQQKEFRQKYEELNAKYISMNQKYEETVQKNKKIEQRYKELKNTIHTYEIQYKNKTHELLKEIEYLKELVSKSVQNSMVSQQSRYNSDIRDVIDEPERKQNKKAKLNLQKRSHSPQEEKKSSKNNYTDILEQFYSNKSNQSSMKKPKPGIDLTEKKLSKQFSNQNQGISPERVAIKQNKSYINQNRFSSPKPLEKYQTKQQVAKIIAQKKVQIAAQIDKSSLNNKKSLSPFITSKSQTKINKHQYIKGSPVQTTCETQPVQCLDNIDYEVLLTENHQSTSIFSHRSGSNSERKHNQPNKSTIKQISLLPSPQSTKKLETFQFDKNTLIVNYGGNSARQEDLKFDYIFKYKESQEDLKKKCIKQIYKQAILPRLINYASHLFLVPMFEPHQLYEMGNDINLIAKMEVTNPMILMNVVQSHTQQMPLKSLILEINCQDNRQTSFVFMRKDDISSTQISSHIRKISLSANQIFSLFIRSSSLTNLKEDILNFKILMKKFLQMSLQVSLNSKDVQEKHLISSLQNQIEDLKQQLHSQCSVINQLCKGKHQPTTKTMLNSKVRNSQEYDSVIIEDDENEDMQNYVIQVEQESKQFGLSTVAAANNQGEGEIEDASFLRKLSIEFNKNYEKFSDFRRSLNLFQNQKLEGKRQSVYSHMQRDNSLVKFTTTDRELQQPHVIKNSSNQLAKELPQFNLKARGEEVKSSCNSTPWHKESLEKSPVEIENIIKCNHDRSGRRNQEKIGSHNSLKVYNNLRPISFKNGKDSAERTSFDSMEMLEVSVANERDSPSVEHNKKEIKPKTNAPSTFMNKLNSTQVVHVSNLKFNKESKDLSKKDNALPPKSNIKQISQLYNSEIPKFPNQKKSQNVSERIAMRGKQKNALSSSVCTGPQQSAASVLNTTNSINNLNQTNQHQSSKIKSQKAKPQNSCSQNAIKNNQKQLNKITTIDFHKVGKYQTGKTSYQSITNNAATALKNLNSKVIQRKRSIHAATTLSAQQSLQSMPIEKQEEKPEIFSRSPSVKDERSSLVTCERPKTMMLQEKNMHQFYFMISPSEEQVRRASAVVSPRPQLNKVLESEQENSTKEIPYFEIQRQQDQRMSRKEEPNKNAEMISKFYQAKSPNPNQYAQQSFQRTKLTDLKQARIKNRSESREKKAQNYTTLNKTGQNISGLLQNMSYHQNAQNTNLNETIQVVKDILTIKRNLSQKNFKQIVPSVNQSQLGINASILFDRNNQSMLHNESMVSTNLNPHYIKRPPTCMPSNHKRTGKENLDEFFVMYESFKQGTSNGHQAKKMVSPDGSKRLFNNEAVPKMSSSNVTNTGFRQRSTSEYSQICQWQTQKPNQVASSSYLVEQPIRKNLDFQTLQQQCKFN